MDRNEGFGVGLWACKAHPVFTAPFDFYLSLTQEGTNDSPEFEVETDGGMEGCSCHWEWLTPF